MFIHSKYSDINNNGPVCLKIFIFFLKLINQRFILNVELEVLLLIWKLQPLWLFVVKAA